MLQNFIKFNNTYNSENKAAYRICSNKIPVNKRLYTFDEIQNANEVGWMVGEGYIVIDADDRKTANAIYRIVNGLKLKCGVHRSKKGAHFIFRQNSRMAIGQVVKRKCALGLEFDTRSEGKGYIILPYKQDEDRQWVKIPDEIDELPSYFFPQNKLKNVPDFSDLGEGSRNDTLFRYYMSVIDYCKGMSIHEKQKTIRIINEYLLEEPLDEEELQQTVLREDLIEGIDPLDLSHEEKNDPYNIAQKITNEQHIITKNDNMYIYRNGYYKFLSEGEMHRIIHLNYDPKAKENARNETIKFVKLMTDLIEDDVDTDTFVINTLNGRVDLRTGNMTEHNEVFYDTIRIPWNYNPNAQPSKHLSNFLSFISEDDANKYALLMEMIGLSMVKKAMFQKMFVLLGEGRNGKSTWLEMVQNVLGYENISNVDLTDLGTSTFRSAELYRKIANINDDLSIKTLTDTGIIKKLVSGEVVVAERKFKNPFTFKSFATMIYATNKLPRTTDRTYGFYRRLCIINFDGFIEKPDAFFMEKIIQEDYEFLLSEAVKYISKALERNELTEYQGSEKALNTYRMESSTVLQFIDECSITVAYADKYPTKDMYMAYKEYTSDIGQKPLSKANFESEFAKIMNMTKKVTTKDGKESKTRWVKL